MPRVSDRDIKRRPGWVYYGLVLSSYYVKHIRFIWKLLFVLTLDGPY